LHASRLTLISAAAALLTLPVAAARPTVYSTGTCSFNGVREECRWGEHTDGYSVIWLSDGKQTFYGKGLGEAPYVGEGFGSSFKTYPATRPTWNTWRTQNGTTVLPIPKPYKAR